MDFDKQELAYLAALRAALGRYAKALGRAVVDYVNYGIVPSGLDAAETAAVRQAIPLLDALIDRRAVRVLGMFGEVYPVGLEQLKEERRKAWRKMAKGAKVHVLDVVDRIPVTPALEDDWRLARVARRRVDKFRTAALDIIGENVKKGDTVTRTQRQLVERLKKLGDGKTITIDINRKTAFRKVKGELYPAPSTMVFDVRQYSELVAITTTREAETKANLIEADNIGTTLVKMPSFGRNYAKEGDPICARIDGKIFSTRKGGSAGASGKVYPYLYGSTDPGKLGYTGIGDTGYLLPHPNCRHIAVPIAEELV